MSLTQKSCTRLEAVDFLLLLFCKAALCLRRLTILELFLCILGDLEAGVCRLVHSGSAVHVANTVPGEDSSQHNWEFYSDVFKRRGDEEMSLLHKN